MQTLYRHYDEKDNLLYIGVSCRIEKRISEHKKHSEWYKKIAKITLEHFETREEVLEAEKNAIINENPKHNKQHRYNGISKVHVKTTYKIDAKSLVTGRLVDIPIMMTPSNWSLHLGIPAIHINSAISEKKLGCIQMGLVGPLRKPKLYCTGWQIIDWLENEGCKC